MLARRADFISRFLDRGPEGKSQGNPAPAPDAVVVQQASAAAKDFLGFDPHRPAFTTLAEIIDACTADGLEVKDSGSAIKSATKHPRIVALAKADPKERAGVSAAAAQGLAWMENCRQWIEAAALGNQIAKGVMTAILVAVGRIKTGYTLPQIGALVRIGAALQDNDAFVVRARGAIAEILAENTKSLAPDPLTVTALREFLVRVVQSANEKPVSKAVEQLTALLPAGQAAALKQAVQKRT